MKKLFLFILLAFVINPILHAQWRTGFKTGLNFSTVSGPKFVDPTTGETLESWKNATNFHIGMTFAHKFTDAFGLRAEVLYSKKGGKYEFKGSSYKIFNTSKGSVFTSGKTDLALQLTNTYIDIPVLAFYRVGSFEFSAGLAAGLLVQSTGNGSLKYSGMTEGGTSTGNLEFNLNYNYRRDALGGYTDGTGTPVAVPLGSQTASVPKTLGAYYDQISGEKNILYKTLDFSALAGVSYYLSRGLYLGLRFQYGLSDITNNKGDVSLGKWSVDKKPVLSSDKDHNILTQLSVGFSF